LLKVVLNTITLNCLSNISYCLIYVLISILIYIAVVTLGIFTALISTMK
jgi:hypothetical protein